MNLRRVLCCSRRRALRYSPSPLRRAPPTPSPPSRAPRPSAARMAPAPSRGLIFRRPSRSMARGICTWPTVPITRSGKSPRPGRSAPWRARRATPIDAGPRPTNGDGTGSAARLTIPAALALDSAGNLVRGRGGRHSDPQDHPRRRGHHRSPADLPMASALPGGIVVASSDMIYVSDTDNNTIRKITFSGGGSVTTLAGGSTPGSDDGSGSAAKFPSPGGPGD